MRLNRKTKNLSSFVRCISVPNGLWQAQKWHGGVTVGDECLVPASFVNHGAPAEYAVALDVANRLEASR